MKKLFFKILFISFLQSFFVSEAQISQLFRNKDRQERREEQDSYPYSYGFFLNMNNFDYKIVLNPKYGIYKYKKNPRQLYVLFILDNCDFKKLCVLFIVLSMMCGNYNFSMFNYLRSNGLCYSVNRRYIECTNRIVANLIIDVSPDKCEITKDYVVDYINNFKLIANNDNIEYAIRMIKLNDRLNIMNIEDYHDAHISFVRSRLNGVMDLYKSYDNISVDDVMDMIKDITENRLIIQYCSL